jgi:hypothetical protein
MERALGEVSFGDYICRYSQDRIRFIRSQKEVILILIRPDYNKFRVSRSTVLIDSKGPED